MAARIVFVTLITVIAVSDMLPTQLMRIPDKVAEANGNALVKSFGLQSQTLINEPYYFKEMPSIGNYPLTTKLGSSFDHRVVSMRPRTCLNQDKTDQPMIHCPTPDLTTVTDWKCIRFTDLCNGVPDCPQREDEHPTFCMFHELQNTEINKLRQIIARMLISNKEVEAAKEPN